MPRKKSKINERAEQAETPNRNKRAGRSQKPNPQERAIDLDESISEERHSEGGRPEKPILYQFALHFQTVQHLRVAIEASLRTRGIVDRSATHIVESLATLEKQVVAILHDEVKKTSIWPWLSDVKGIGPRLGGMLIGLIDIRRCNTISALWRYAGQAVIDGRAERRHAGETTHYNDRLKKTCFLIARSLVMARNEKYEPIYRAAKERYRTERPDWTVTPDGKKVKGGDLHIDLAARRVMVKIFLSNLWVAWREAEGLPVTNPYVEDFLGHSNIIR